MLLLFSVDPEFDFSFVMEWSFHHKLTLRLEMIDLNYHLVKLDYSISNSYQALGLDSFKV